jgi:hypothetical protein
VTRAKRSLIPAAGLAFLLCAFCAGLPARAEEESYLARTLRFHIVVHDPADTADRLVTWAESRGGYFLHMSADRVSLRLPLEHAPGFRAYVEERAEELLDVSVEARDLRERLVQLRAGIRSREEILARNLAFLGQADVEGTLAIEREIMELVSRVESMKGELRTLEVDRRYLLAEVVMSFKDQTLPADVPSSFEWINSVDFHRFVEGDRARHTLCCAAVRMETPEGFAEYRKGGLFSRRTPHTLVSPEGIELQVRVVKGYPRQDLEFWADALRNHLREEGYSLIVEGDSFETGRGRGVYFEWIVPYGSEGWVYLTSIVLTRRRILIAECAGEYSLYRTYQTALRESLATITMRRRFFTR